MMGTQQQRELAHAALWRIPTYVASPVQQKLTELTTGADLGEIIGSILTALQGKPCQEARGQAEAGLESFKVYGYICRQLEDLLAEPENDEFGMVRPAACAVVEAKRKLFQVAKGKVLPKPEDISTDRDGGLRISWRNDGRFLELVFPHETDVRPYLYYSEGPLFDISEDLTDSQLHRWVRWVDGDTRPKFSPTASADQTH